MTALLGALLVPGFSTSSPIGGSREFPRRVALLIGISDYQYFKSFGPPGRSDLLGPLHDLHRMQRVLERRYGFETRMLADSLASRQGIRQALRWLADQVETQEDAVVLYFSGHGSFTRDLDGDESDPERGGTPGDSLDEGLVPWDAYDVHDPTNLILDDELREWLAEIETPNVTVIIDACFSGTVTRAFSTAVPRGVAAPPSEGSSLDRAAPSHVLVTASAADELAYERPFPSALEETLYHGVLSYHLVRALAEAPEGVRYDDLVATVSAEIASASRPGETQTPQLEGRGSAPLWHVGADVATRTWATARIEDGGGVELDEGALHGVRAGMVYDLYGPEEKEFRSDPPGRIRVETVGLETSRGRLEASTEEVGPVGRAVVSRVPPGASRIDAIDVFVEEAAGGARAAVESIPFTRVAEDSLRTHVRLLSRPDGLLSLRIGPDSLPPIEGPAGYRASVDDLCGPLRRAFAIVSFSAIENPAPSEIQRLRLALVPAGSAPGDGSSDDRAIDSLVIGRRYDLWARVDAPEEMRPYMTVALGGYTDEPAVLWPLEDASANERLASNRWSRLVGPLTATEPGGVEALFAVASPDPYDFRSFVRRLPSCGLSRGGAGGNGEGRALPGWRSARHDILLSPAGRTP